jgi:hypothetical protein
MDPLAYVRTQALSLTYTLLRDKPEQEHNLLRLLVNKLVSGKKSKLWNNLLMMVPRVILKNLYVLALPITSFNSYKLTHL